MSLALIAESGRGLPRNRELRARLKPHLDADPELLAALLIHLELARDDLGVDAGRLREPAADLATPLPSDGEAG